MLSVCNTQQELNLVNMSIQTTGLPLEVAIYHPIEFLELKKLTIAFLDLNLEKEKGGIKNQLLVGHVITFLQKNGIAALADLPRFRTDYWEDLAVQCRKKGVDLEHLGQYDLVLNSEKAQKLSDADSVYQSDDAFDKAANIYSSSNHSMFHFLEFNRKITRKHVNNLVESMKENGILSYPLMIYTDCIDGTWKYWIIDGQHRFEAFKKMGYPIRFTLYQKSTPEPITVYDIVR